MPLQKYGNHSVTQSWESPSTKQFQKAYRNNLTRRNVNIIEHMPARKLSSSLASANIKALRLFRYICRMVPFILKVHEVEYRFDALQTKRYIANVFRQNSKLTNLTAIDSKIQQGYEFVQQAQWHFTNTGYMYRYLAGNKFILRDQGRDKFQENRGNQNKKQPASKFLKDFYHGNKTHNQ